MNTISIPSSFLNAGTLATTVRFIDSIEQWCAAELLGAVHLRYVSFGERVMADYPFEASFDEDKDAIHFKMRWL